MLLSASCCMADGALLRKSSCKAPASCPAPYPLPTRQLLAAPAHVMCPWMHPLPHLLCRSEMEGETTRPPLCVTACVETIELYTSSLNLRQDMKVGGVAALVLPGAQGAEPSAAAPDIATAGLIDAYKRVEVQPRRTHFNLPPSCSAPCS